MAINSYQHVKCSKNKVVWETSVDLIKKLWSQIYLYYHHFREKMAQAYDFALDKIGMDIHSYSIWNDYVNFLKAVEAVGSYAENQKISAVRKVRIIVLYQ